MKTIYFMRHAKSSWDHPDLDDHARPLNDRGRRVASQMGKWLAETGPLPQQIIGSDALRVVQTIDRLIADWSPTPPIEYLPQLYLAPPSTILDSLREVNAGLQTIMVVGHNPGMAFLASRWTQEETHFPTAACAVVQVELPSFADIARSPDACRLLKILRPKELGFN